MCGSEHIFSAAFDVPISTLVAVGAEAGVGRDSDIERHMMKMTREVGRRLKPIPSLQRDFITYSGHGKMKETRKEEEEEEKEEKEEDEEEEE